jgi:hypothetical protein
MMSRLPELNLSPRRSADWPWTGPLVDLLTGLDARDVYRAALRYPKQEGKGG